MDTKKPTLRELLNKVAEENHYENYEIEIKELLCGGANITSELYTAVIKQSNREDLHIFAKISVIGEKVRMGMPPSFFYTEAYCYTTLWNTYRALEDENGLQDEDRLMFTKSYGFDLTMPQETALLENLSAQGYENFDRRKSIDWSYAASAVTELAKLHSLSFAYRQSNPEEFDSVVAYVKKDWNEVAMACFEQIGLTNAIKYANPEHLEALENYLSERLRNVLVHSFAPISHTVLVHADYKPSNLMHRVLEVSSECESLS
ncbi:unnamed protein product [Chrysodeixis includens]|uniref:Uncharacterized protein n=1 Tax=Chrysodeixis includens TaxID=689277 RepID=A0A9N8L3Q2_CHRIL|nr:unnamed protein product [Chrysodeixis includens]